MKDKIVQIISNTGIYGLSESGKVYSLDTSDGKSSWTLIIESPEKQGEKNNGIHITVTDEAKKKLEEAKQA
jgi:outer membrane protein assembly factor BamB